MFEKAKKNINKKKKKKKKTLVLIDKFRKNWRIREDGYCVFQYCKVVKSTCLRAGGRKADSRRSLWKVGKY